MSLKRTHRESECLEKEEKYEIFWCLLLMKATLENFRISLNKCLSFLYLSYDV